MADATTGQAAPERPSPAVLRGAVDAARYAPSIHNTQPWRWHVGPAALDLYADRNRQLAVTDPDAHLLTLSCGAALYQATVALRAEGWKPVVTRLPDPGEPDLLAHIAVTEQIPVSPATMRHFQSGLLRHTDRRPVGPEQVDDASIEAIRRAAEAQGAHIHVLRDDQVVELAVAASSAAEAESADAALQAELAQWVGGLRESGAGVPEGALPPPPPQARVPHRDFGVTGPELPSSPPHPDKGARYLIVFGDEDTPRGWLRGGEALQAAWLTAIEHALSVMPLSAVVEVPATRVALRRILGGIGYPYLVLRVGVPTRHQPLPHTPRLPAETVITPPRQEPQNG